MSRVVKVLIKLGSPMSLSVRTQWGMVHLISYSSVAVK